ncbi:MAG: hypothetical protein U5M23_04395 [Marinagarivorans sp.]|nr:hypothetical protein [Marinagarivorans sp.]
MAEPKMTAVTTEAADCINCYREELLIYLVQRFGSLNFAQRVLSETLRRLDDCDVLNYVPNPHIYLIGYALSLGIEFMQADMKEAKQASNVKAIANATAAFAENAFTNNYILQGPISGGELWQPQPASSVH